MTTIYINKVIMRNHDGSYYHEELLPPAKTVELSKAIHDIEQDDLQWDYHEMFTMHEAFIDTETARFTHQITEYTFIEDEQSLKDYEARVYESIMTEANEYTMPPREALERAAFEFNLRNLLETFAETHGTTYFTPTDEEWEQISDLFADVGYTIIKRADGTTFATAPNGDIIEDTTGYIGKTIALATAHYLSDED